jgi:hypothetical protein
MTDGDGYVAFSWMNEWQGKPKYSEKTCPRAVLPTTVPAFLDPGLNPAANCVSYCAAFAQSFVASERVNLLV